MTKARSSDHPWKREPTIVRHRKRVPKGVPALPSAVTPAVEPAAPEAQPSARILMHGVVVAPLLAELEANPDLWDANRCRAPRREDEPRSGVSDIIVRYNDWKNWADDLGLFNMEHESVWWEAYEKLPAIEPLVFDLARLFRAEQIGMVMVTRQPPHTTVDAQVDSFWHAQYYLHFALQLKSAPGQRFCVDEINLETLPGDLYVYRNDRRAWVENPTDEERLTLIICLRLKQPTCFDCRWAGE